MPLAVLSLNPFFRSDLSHRDFFIPVGYGILSSVPGFIVFWTLKGFFSLKWSFSNLYFSELLSGIGLELFIVSFLWLLFHLMKNDERIYLRESLLWFGTYFFIFNISDFFLFERTYSSLDLFIIPLLRIGMTLLASFLADIYLKVGLRGKILTLVFFLLLTFLISFIPVFFRFDMILYSFISMFIIFFAGIVLFIFRVRGLFSGI